MAAEGWAPQTRLLNYTGGAGQGQKGEAKRGAAPGRGCMGAPAPGRERHWWLERC